MRHVSFALLLVPACVAWAQDPLHSKECGIARATLEHALDGGVRGRIDAARKEAIAACLGRESASRQRSGAPEPPIVVPAPVIEAPRPPAVPAVVAAPPAPQLAIARPATITTCDPGGCWDSEGRRLNQLGPALIGPRGACTVQAGIVTCP